MSTATIELNMNTTTLNESVNKIKALHDNITAAVNVAKDGIIPTYNGKDGTTRDTNIGDVNVDNLRAISTVIDNAESDLAKLRGSMGKVGEELANSFATSMPLITSYIQQIEKGFDDIGKSKSIDRINATINSMMVNASALGSAMTSTQNVLSTYNALTDSAKKILQKNPSVFGSIGSSVASYVSTQGIRGIGNFDAGLVTKIMADVQNGDPITHALKAAGIQNEADIRGILQMAVQSHANPMLRETVTKQIANRGFTFHSKGELPQTFLQSIPERYREIIGSKGDSKLDVPNGSQGWLVKNIADADEVARSLSFYKKIKNEVANGNHAAEMIARESGLLYRKNGNVQWIDEGSLTKGQLDYFGGLAARRYLISKQGAPMYYKNTNDSENDEKLLRYEGKASAEIRRVMEADERAKATPTLIRPIDLNDDGRYTGIVKYAKAKQGEYRYNLEHPEMIQIPRMTFSKDGKQMVMPSVNGNLVPSINYQYRKENGVEARDEDSGMMKGRSLLMDRLIDLDSGKRKFEGNSYGFGFDGDIKAVEDTPFLISASFKDFIPNDENGKMQRVKVETTTASGRGGKSKGKTEIITDQERMDALKKIENGEITPTISSGGSDVEYVFALGMSTTGSGMMIQKADKQKLEKADVKAGRHSFLHNYEIVDKEGNVLNAQGLRLSKDEMSAYYEHLPKIASESIAVEDMGISTDAIKTAFVDMSMFYKAGAETPKGDRIDGITYIMPNVMGVGTWQTRFGSNKTEMTSGDYKKVIRETDGFHTYGRVEKTLEDGKTGYVEDQTGPMYGYFPALAGTTKLEDINRWIALSKMETLTADEYAEMQRIQDTEMIDLLSDKYNAAMMADTTDKSFHQHSVDTVEHYKTLRKEMYKKQHPKAMDAEAEEAVGEHIAKLKTDSGNRFLQSTNKDGSSGVEMIKLNKEEAEFSQNLDAAYTIGGRRYSGYRVMNDAEHVNDDKDFVSAAFLSSIPVTNEMIARSTENYKKRRDALKTPEGIIKYALAGNPMLQNKVSENASLIHSDEVKAAIVAAQNDLTQKQVEGQMLLPGLRHDKTSVADMHAVFGIAAKKRGIDYESPSFAGFDEGTGKAVIMTGSEVGGVNGGEGHVVLSRAPYAAGSAMYATIKNDDETRKFIEEHGYDPNAYIVTPSTAYQTNDSDFDYDTLETFAGFEDYELEKINDFQLKVRKRMEKNAEIAKQDAENKTTVEPTEEEKEGYAFVNHVLAKRVSSQGMGRAYGLAMAHRFFKDYGSKEAIAADAEGNKSYRDWADTLKHPDLTPEELSRESMVLTGLGKTSDRFIKSLLKANAERMETGDDTAMRGLDIVGYMLPLMYDNVSVNQMLGAMQARKYDASMVAPIENAFDHYKAIATEMLSGGGEKEFVSQYIDLMRDKTTGRYQIEGEKKTEALLKAANLWVEEAERGTDAENTRRAYQSVRRATLEMEQGVSTHAIKEAENSTIDKEQARKLRDYYGFTYEGGLDPFMVDWMQGRDRRAEAMYVMDEGKYVNTPLSEVPIEKRAQVAEAQRMRRRQTAGMRYLSAGVTSTMNFAKGKFTFTNPVHIYGAKNDSVNDNEAMSLDFNPANDKQNKYAKEAAIEALTGEVAPENMDAFIGTMMHATLENVTGEISRKTFKMENNEYSKAVENSKKLFKSMLLNKVNGETEEQKKERAELLSQTGYSFEERNGIIVVKDNKTGEDESGEYQKKIDFLLGQSRDDTPKYLTDRKGFAGLFSESGAAYDIFGKNEQVVMREGVFYNEKGNPLREDDDGKILMHPADSPFLRERKDGTFSPAGFQFTPDFITKKQDENGEDEYTIYDWKSSLTSAKKGLLQTAIYARMLEKKAIEAYTSGDESLAGFKQLIDYDNVTGDYISKIKHLKVADVIGGNEVFVDYDKKLGDAAEYFFKNNMQRVAFEAARNGFDGLVPADIDGVVNKKKRTGKLHGELEEDTVNYENDKLVEKLPEVQEEGVVKRNGYTPTGDKEPNLIDQMYALEQMKQRDAAFEAAQKANNMINSRFNRGYSGNGIGGYSQTLGLIDQLKEDARITSLFDDVMKGTKTYDELSQEEKNILDQMELLKHNAKLESNMDIDEAYNRRANGGEKGTGFSSIGTALSNYQKISDLYAGLEAYGKTETFKKGNIREGTAEFRTKSDDWDGIVAEKFKGTKATEAQADEIAYKDKISKLKELNKAYDESAQREIEESLKENEGYLFGVGGIGGKQFDYSKNITNMTESLAQLQELSGKIGAGTDSSSGLGRMDDTRSHINIYIEELMMQLELIKAAKDIEDKITEDMKKLYSDDERGNLLKQLQVLRDMKNETSDDKKKGIIDEGMKGIRKKLTDIDKTQERRRDAMRIDQLVAAHPTAPDFQKESINRELRDLAGKYGVVSPADQDEMFKERDTAYASRIALGNFLGGSKGQQLAELMNKDDWFRENYKNETAMNQLYEMMGIGGITKEERRNAYVNAGINRRDALLKELRENGKIDKDGNRTDKFTIEDELQVRTNVVSRELLEKRFDNLDRLSEQDYKFRRDQIESSYKKEEAEIQSRYMPNISYGNRGISGVFNIAQQNILSRKRDMEAYQRKAEVAKHTRDQILGKYQTKLDSRTDYDADGKITDAAISSGKISEEDARAYNEAVADESHYSVLSAEIGKIFSSDGKITAGNLMKELGKSAVSMMPAALAMAAVRKMRKSVSDAYNFWKQNSTEMGEIQGITLKSDDEMEAISEKSMQQAIDLRTSSSTVNKVKSALYRQGLSDAQVETGTEDVIKFSKVSGTDISSSIKGLTTAVNSGLVSSLEEAMDAMTALGDAAATTAGEISKAMQKCASTAEVANVSYDELVAMLTIVEEKTQLSGTQVGTAFNTIFTRMSKVNNSEFVTDEGGNTTSINDVEEALAMAGVKMRDGVDNKDLRSTYDILSDLAKVWERLSDLQKSNIATNLAGTRQSNIFYSLMEGMSENGGELMEEYLEQIDNSGGITDEKYAENIDTLSGSLEGFKESWNSVIEALDASEAIMSVVDFFSMLTQGMANLASIDVVGIVTPIVAAIGAIVAAYLAFKAAINATGAIKSLAAVAAVTAGATAILGTGLIAGLIGNGTTTKLSTSDKEANVIETENKKIEYYSERIDSITELENAYETLEKITEKHGTKIENFDTFEDLGEDAEDAAAAVETIGDEMENLGALSQGAANNIETIQKGLQWMSDNSEKIKAESISGIVDAALAYTNNGAALSALQEDFDENMGVVGENDYMTGLLKWGSDANGKAFINSSRDNEYSVLMQAFGFKTSNNWNELGSVERSQAIEWILDHGRGTDETAEDVSDFAQMLYNTDTVSGFKEYYDKHGGGVSIGQGWFNYINSLDREEKIAAYTTAFDYIAGLNGGYLWGNPNTIEEQRKKTWDDKTDEIFSEGNPIYQAIAALYGEDYVKAMKEDFQSQDGYLSIANPSEYFAVLSTYLSGKMGYDTGLTKRMTKQNSDFTYSSNGFFFDSQEEEGINKELGDIALYEILNGTKDGFETYNTYSNKALNGTEEEQKEALEVLNGMRKTAYETFVNKYSNMFELQTDADGNVIGIKFKNPEAYKENLQYNDETGDKVYPPFSETVSNVAGSISHEDMGYTNEYKMLYSYFTQNKGKTKKEIINGIGIAIPNSEAFLKSDAELARMLDDQTGAYSVEDIAAYIYDKIYGESYAETLSNINTAGYNAWQAYDIGKIASADDLSTAQDEAIIQTLGISENAYYKNKDRYLAQYKAATARYGEELKSEAFNAIMDSGFGAFALQTDDKGEYVIDEATGKYLLNKGVSENFKDAWNAYLETLSGEEKARAEQIMAAATQYGVGIEYDESTGMYTSTLNLSGIDFTYNPMKNYGAYYTGKQRADLAKTLMGYGSIGEIENAVATGSLTMDTDAWDDLAENYPELIEWLNMNEDQQNSAYGRALTKQINAQISLQGVSDLEAAGEVIAGITDNLEKIKTSDALTAFQTITQMADTNTTYELAKQGVANAKAGKFVSSEQLSAMNSIYGETNTTNLISGVTTPETFKAETAGIDEAKQKEYREQYAAIVMSYLPDNIQEGFAEYSTDDFLNAVKTEQNEEPFANAIANTEARGWSYDFDTGEASYEPQEISSKNFGSYAEYQNAVQKGYDLTHYTNGDYSYLQYVLDYTTKHGNLNAGYAYARYFANRDGASGALALMDEIVNNSEYLELDTEEDRLAFIQDYYDQHFGITKDYSKGVNYADVSRIANGLINGDESIKEEYEKLLRSNTPEDKALVAAIQNNSYVTSAYTGVPLTKREKMIALGTSGVLELTNAEEEGEAVRGSANAMNQIITGTADEATSVFTTWSDSIDKVQDAYTAMSAIESGSKNGSNWETIGGLLGWSTDTMDYYKAHGANEKEMDKIQEQIAERGDDVTGQMKDVFNQMFETYDASDFSDLKAKAPDLTSYIEFFEQMLELQGLAAKFNEGKVEITPIEEEEVTGGDVVAGAEEASGYAADLDTREQAIKLVEIVTAKDTTAKNLTTKVAAANLDTDAIYKAYPEIANIMAAQGHWEVTEEGESKSPVSAYVVYEDGKLVFDPKRSRSGPVVLDSEYTEGVGKHSLEYYKAQAQEAVGETPEFGTNYWAIQDFAEAIQGKEPEDIKTELETGEIGIDFMNLYNGKFDDYQIDLTDLTKGGDEASETIAKLNRLMMIEGVRAAKAFGDATDDVCDTLEGMEGDFDQVSNAIKTVNNRMRSLSNSKYYRDLWKSGDRSLETREYMAEYAGGQAEDYTAGGRYEKLGNAYIEATEEEFEDSENETAAAFLNQMLQEKMNQYFADNNIEITDPITFEFAGGVATNFGGGWNQLETEAQNAVSQMLNETAASAEGMIVKLVAQISGTDDGVIVESVLADVAGSPTSGGGGGGGKSAAEKLIEKLKNQKTLWEHKQKMAQNAQSLYEATGQLASKGEAIKGEIEVDVEYMQVLKEQTEELKNQLAVTKQGSDDWYSLRDAIMENEEAMSELTTTIVENTKALMENQIAIKKTITDVEDMANEAIEAQEEKEDSMLEGSVQMQQTILQAIQQRYSDEWELLSDDIEKKKEALEEEKSLIDERLQKRKDAADEEKKYEELAEYQKQYALISMDSTRTKDAKELEEKIKELEEELYWDAAEDEAEAQQEALDEQIEAYDEYVETKSEDLEDYLEDANNFMAEVNSVMELSQEELFDWLKANVEEYVLSFEDYQKQMVESWEDTYNQMLGITVTYWAEVAEIMSSRDSFIEYMKTTDEYVNATDAKKEQLLYEWELAYYNMQAATADAVEYSHEDEYADETTSTTTTKKSTNNNKKEDTAADTTAGTTADTTSNQTSTRPYETATGTTTGTTTGTITYQTSTRPYESATTTASTTNQATTVTDATGARKPAASTTDTNKNKNKKYAGGGLVDYTGLAWVDGSFGEPEAFLNADDTKLIRQMLDSAKYTGFIPQMTDMSGINITGNSVNVGDVYVTLNEAEIASEDDYETVAQRVGEAFVKELSKNGLNIGQMNF